MVKTPADSPADERPQDAGEQRPTVDELLVHNSTLLLLKDAYLAGVPRLRSGIYRSILDEKSLNLHVIVHIGSLDEQSKPIGRGGRKKLPSEQLTRKRKKAPPPSVGKLIWVDRDQLVSEIDSLNLRAIAVHRDKDLSTRGSDEDDLRYAIRLAVSEPFLDYPTLRDEILACRDLSAMVEAAVEKHKVSRELVYKLWSNLCRWGFSEESLKLRRPAGGAPGVPRRLAGKPDPADRWPRRKAGRRTEKERLAAMRGSPIEPEQPGMSDVWAAQIFAADRAIPSPKPDWPDRITQVRNNGFHAVREISPGKFKFVLEKGTYPNPRQIQRVLRQGVVERCKEKVSPRTFDVAHKAHTGYAHMGIGGPSHQWVIDSTVGDVYLRSSLNRAWIIGRPVVYVIVDTWSTAVVGFHVCLTGPSWEMASVALFNATVGEATLAPLFGVEAMPLLYPEPAFYYDLLCDRGEYLSKSERATALRLKFKSSYTRAYTPYLKGIVEVLHRIAKDRTYYFVPGAFDMRRDEWFRNRRAYKLSAMTLAEYTNYLHLVFLIYNLTGDRRGRLDARMIAEYVSPTPAGLWRWGYEAGLAFRKVIPRDDLIWNLLPAVRVTVNGDGIFHGGCKYGSTDSEKMEHWSTFAKNFGTYSMEGRYFPASMGSVWVREREGSSLAKLTLLDQTRVSPDLSCNEWADARSLQCTEHPSHEHETQKTLSELGARMSYIVEGAKAKTSEAMANSDSYPALTPSEARALEVGVQMSSSKLPLGSKVATSGSVAVEEWRREMAEEYEKAMTEALENANHSI